MSELLKTIIKQFNNILIYDSNYFKILILDPLLMNDASFLTLYNETVDFYRSDDELHIFQDEPPMQKNAIVYKLMLFACRRKSIADGRSQLEFYKMICHEGMLQNKKIFTELIIPWLEDFRIIRETPLYSELLNYYTYKIPISNVPMHGNFAMRINQKIFVLEYEAELVRKWWWGLFCW